MMLTLPQLCPQGTVVQWKFRSLPGESDPQEDQACPCQECPKVYKEERRKEGGKKERKERSKVRSRSHSHDGLSMAWE